VKNYNSQSEKL